jgi:hypothetical protein
MKSLEHCTEMGTIPSHETTDNVTMSRFAPSQNPDVPTKSTAKRSAGPGKMRRERDQRRSIKRIYPMSTQILHPYNLISQYQTSQFHTPPYTIESPQLDRYQTTQNGQIHPPNQRPQPEPPGNTGATHLRTHNALRRRIEQS